MRENFEIIRVHCYKRKWQQNTNLESNEGQDKEVTKSKSDSEDVSLCYWTCARNSKRRKIKVC